MEKQSGRKFGDLKKPLLVAVRSGARDSMPGMMDTILNLGLNDETVLALVKATKNDRFAWDCYRRFIQMYGDVVMGVQKRAGEDHEPFEALIEEYKAELFPGRRSRTPRSRSPTSGRWSPASKPSSRNAPARNFRRTPGNNSGAPYRPSSAPG